MTKLIYSKIFVCLSLIGFATQAYCGSTKEDAHLMAAIETKRNAAIQVEKILDKVKGTPRYFNAIEKLAIIYFDIAQLQGELSVLGQASLRSNSSNTSHGYFRKTIQYTTLVLGAAPQATRMLLLRGQSHKELGDWQSAITDFKRVVSINPKSLDAVTATFVAYDTLIEKQEFDSARLLLEKLELAPGHSHYLLSMEYLANVYFRMKSYSHALKLIEKSLARDSHSESNMSKFEAHRKAVFSLAAQIFAAAIEAKEGEYSPKTAISFYTSFGRISELPKLMTEVAVQLRVRNLEPAMENFSTILKDLQAPKGIVFSTRVSVEQVVLEYFVKKTIRDSLEKSLGRMHETYLSLRDISNEEKAKIDAKISNQSKVVLRQGITAWKGQGESVLRLLAKFYECLLLVPEENQVAILTYHLDVAQIYEKIQSFNAATDHFRWVAVHSQMFEKLDQQNRALAKEASLRAIVARYQVFKERKEVPEDLKVTSLEKKSTTDLKPELKEWMNWVDSEPKQEGSEVIQTMIFEKNRFLYQNGQKEAAIRGLNQLLKNYPKTSYAESALMLMVDTYMTSQYWEQVVQTTLSALKSSLVLKPEFRISLEQSGSLAYLRWLEDKMKKEEYKSVIKGTDQTLKDFPNTQYKNELLAIAGHAALKLNNTPLAISYFTKFDRKTAKKEFLQVADMTVGNDAEEKMNFSDAVQSYRSYLKQKQDEQLIKKVLLLSWMTGDPKVLKESLDDPEVCGKKSKADNCDQYQAILQLMLSVQNSETNVDQRIEAWKHSPKDSKFIWATSVLNHKKKLPWKDRLQALQQALANLDDADPLLKMVLLNQLSESLPRHLEDSKQEIPRISPLKLSKHSISKRVELVKSLENALQDGVDSQWTHLKVICDLALASIYKNIASDLEKLPAPKGLTASDLTSFKSTLQDLAAPFRSKAIEYIEKAYQVATTQGVDSDLMNQVTSFYFEERPKDALELNENWSVVQTAKVFPSLVALNLSLWRESPELWKNWRDFLSEGNIQKAGYLVLYAKAQSKLTDPQMQKLVEGMTLARVGAISESFKILAQLIPEAEKALGTESCQLLISHAFISFSKDLVRGRLKLCEGYQSRMNSELMNHVSVWLSPKVKKDETNEKK